MRQMTPMLALLLLAACTDQPSHIPNPLALPVQGLATAVQNAGYNARRGRVARYVTDHHAEIVGEITSGGGPALSTAMQLAWIASPKRAAITRLLARDIALYRDDPEALVVALMVHGA